MIADIRRAALSLTRSWGTTIVVVLTMAVGIAVLTTIFSFVNSALLRPLPYPDADRILAIGTESSGAPTGFSRLQLGTVRELRASVGSFDAIAAFREGSVTLSGVGDATRVGVTEVDPALFPMLHAQVQLGSLPTADQIRGGESLVVLSDRLWRERFGAASDVVGRIVRMDGAPHTVTGVMERGFRFYERSDLWRPLVENEGPTNGEASTDYSVIGRLRPGVSLAQARSEVDLIGRRLATTRPDDPGKWSLVVRDGMVDRGARAWGPFALLLLGAAVFVLLVASTNVVNLLLIRASARRGEVAIRSALGASRGRLIRQSLTESVLLAVAASAVGVVLAVWGIGLITALIPLSGMPSWVRLGVDLRVMAFVLAISLITVLLVGLVPALEGARVDITGVLKSGADGAATGRTSRRGSALAVAELTLALVLCIGATTIARTFFTLMALDPGYQPERVLALHIPLVAERYPDSARQRAFHEELRQQLRDRPGVAGTAMMGSFAGLSGDMGTVDASGPPDRRLFLPTDQNGSATTGLRPIPSFEVISDSLFSVLGLELLRGRGFDPGDRAGSAPVVIVSDRLARHVWREEDPIGQALRVGKAGPFVTVVGVVSSRRDPTFGARGLGTDPLPAVYFSERQAEEGSVSLLVRAAGDPDALKPAVVEAVRVIDPDQAAGNVQTMAEEMAIVTTVIRALAAIFATFTICALGLGLLGVYSVVAEGVAQRTREIGIRMALGATEGDVLRDVASRGVRVTGLGLAIGLPAAWMLSRAMGGVLYGIVPLHAGVYAGVALGFGAITLLAMYGPARRATRVDPATALRDL